MNEFNHIGTNFQGRQIIVNADDFGADRHRDAGIAAAVAAGAVTSVSVLANGPSLDDGRHRPRRHRGGDAGVAMPVGAEIICVDNKSLHLKTLA